jgi:peptidoglycan/LPS O-acetylase OafA/YrhL
VTKTATPARIPSLDGLRAISIALVLVDHLARSRYFPPVTALLPFNTAGYLGNLGVRAFFVISGFLITTLLIEERRKNGRISLPLFYLRRTLRIFPAFYVFLLAMGILAASRIISLRPGDMLHAVTYTINYHYDREWWLGHIWSLAVEEQFYLIWPFLMVLAGTRKAMMGAVAVVLTAPALRLGLLMLYPGKHAWMGEAFPLVADALATGCLLAGFREALIANRWYRGLLESRVFGWVPLLALLANSYPGGRIHSAIFDSAVNFAIAITVDRYVRMPATTAGRFLNWRPVAFIGVLSYSLYLWQQPILRHGDTLLPFPISLLCVFAMACLSYRFVETPFLTLRKRLEGCLLRRTAGATSNGAGQEWAPQKIQ